MDLFVNKNIYTRQFCFVDGCFTTSERNKNLGFHKFPPIEKRNIIKINKFGVKKYVNRRQLWIETLNIDKKTTTVIGEMTVCSLHFSRKDFVTKDEKRPFAHLKSTAIPRRNLPLRKNSKLTTRFQFRSFNRIKWRGRLAFQDPDGRLPVSRRRCLGENRSLNFKYQSFSSENDVKCHGIQKYKFFKRIKKYQKPVGHKNNPEGGFDSSNIQLKTFSLAGQTHGLTFNEENDDKEIQKEEFLEKEEEDIQCTVDNIQSDPSSDKTNNSQSLFTHEVIIKEEPLSDVEQENYENYWLNEVLADEYKTADSYKEVSDNMVELKVKNDTSKRTTKEVLNDLESSEDDWEEKGGVPVLENETKDLEEVLSQNSEAGIDEFDVTDNKNLWKRDRPCKMCGKIDCKGHPTQRPCENIFVCLVCGDIFDSRKLLDLHNKIHHEDTENFSNKFEQDRYFRHQRQLTCLICKKILATKITLKEHMSIHTGEKPYICILCDRAFRHKANLVVHINAHTIIRTFECPICPQTFSMRVDLEDHKRTHQDQRKYKCSICSIGFHTKKALWLHRQSHNNRRMHGKKKKKHGLKKGGLPCRVCGKILSTKNTLKEHMMIHSGEKPHECLLCGKMIRHKANFILHVQSHASNNNNNNSSAGALSPNSKNILTSTLSFTKSKLDIKVKKVIMGPLFTKMPNYNKNSSDNNNIAKTNIDHKSNIPSIFDNNEYHCILCGDSFHNEDGLRNHVETEHGDNCVNDDNNDDKIDSNDTVDSFKKPLPLLMSNRNVDKHNSSNDITKVVINNDSTNNDIKFNDNSVVYRYNDNDEAFPYKNNINTDITSFHSNIFSEEITVNSNRIQTQTVINTSIHA